MEVERAAIAPRLIEWGHVHGRHDLPWQHPPTPYHVWVSEIMLQQTQVATVIPYFERFMARFPTLAALVDAELSDVLALWSGLGYYARARNLHAAARRCVEAYDANLPEGLDELTALPGIGRSTAGAILALAHNRHAPILDGNAKRVLARYHGVAGWSGKNTVALELWQLAEKETPAQQVAAYTQALMDLGATICTRAAPACQCCPLAAHCTAHALGSETALPAPRPTRPRPLRKRCYALIERAEKILFEKRPPAGIWGGLLCLPELPDGLAPESWCETALGARSRSCRELAGFHHEFTHFRLDARVIALSVEGKAGRESDRYCWLSNEAALQTGLPAPIRTWLTARQERQAAQEEIWRLGAGSKKAPAASTKVTDSLSQTSKCRTDFLLS